MQLSSPVWTTVLKLAIFTSAMALGSLAHADKSECSDVLKDGAKATQLYHENNEYRRLLETKLSTMTFQQAKSDTSLTGNIPIGDLLIGVGFSEQSFNEYKSFLQSDTTLYIQSSHTLDVMLTTGDSTIVSTWLACMQNKKGGLALRFRQVELDSAVLVIQWFADVGVAEVRIAQDFILPAGVKITSGESFLKGTRSIIAGTQHEVKFELSGPTTTVALTLNAVQGDTPRGADSTFLPSRMSWQRETRPYQFNVDEGICSTKQTIYLDTPRHSGTTLPTTTYCSHFKDGWRFSTRPSDFNVAVGVAPSSIPSTQFGTAPYFWTGDGQFNVSLGCSSSTNTDIQCSATTRLLEERYVWKPLQALALK
jgi:hypothetical protein